MSDIRVIRLLGSVINGAYPVWMQYVPLSPGRNHDLFEGNQLILGHIYTGQPSRRTSSS